MKPKRPRSNPKVVRKTVKVWTDDERQDFAKLVVRGYTMAAAAKMIEDERKRETEQKAEQKREKRIQPPRHTSKIHGSPAVSQPTSDPENPITRMRAAISEYYGDKPEAENGSWMWRNRPWDTDTLMKIANTKLKADGRPQITNSPNWPV